MSGVSAMQLVVHPSAGHEASIDAVERRDNARPWDYANDADGTRPAILGSKGLLQLASMLGADEYRLIEVDLRDTSYEPLDEAIEVQLETAIKSSVLHAVQLSTMSDLLIQNGATILSITLRLPNTPAEFTVNRDGEVRIQRGGSLSNFLSALGRSLGYQYGV